MKLQFWLILLLLLAAASALADANEVYHLKLLAVQEAGDHLKGSGAELFLELNEGSGRVFLETFPLTKIDTQISTRFAKDIACKHFKLNCDKYDYIFTIKADSNIIGGPSAGAAIAALTTIATLDLDYDEKIAITGTINSGGIIGPVGGVKEKVEAAQESGLKTVLIAKNNGYRGENQTDVIDYARENLSLEVTEVNDLDEVILHLTGVDLNHKEFTVIEDPNYTKIMGNLQNALCQRAEEIEAEILEKGFFLDREIQRDIRMRKGRADNATLTKDYYSAASFCFGLNIQLKTKLLEMQNATKGRITREFTHLERRAKAVEETLDQEKIETITDLQTLMVVKERLNDVNQQIEESRINSHKLSELYSLLSYAEERLFSAVSWMEFFKMEGKKFVMNAELLRESCMQKISESEERNQYASLFAPQHDVSDKINGAKKALEEDGFALCLIIASQAKAQSNAVLSSMGLREEIIDDFIESKRTVTERIIAENTAEGMFPILGYSYYQYANSLQDHEKISALLYLEYALEMSEISIYFPEEKTFLENAQLSLSINEKWLYLVLGFAAGVAISLYLVIKNPLWFRQKKKVKKNKSKEIDTAIEKLP
ncbi:hypothetical protein J4479_00900 [Candidatus Woesearchaeota archaeon]|nr:hypothetical protein [Candidatus Woesearchaeota archaeon]